MPAFIDPRSKQWRYRKSITLANGTRIRISGTPEANTKAAAEAAERAAVMRALHDGHAPIGRPPAAGEARTVHVATRASEAEDRAWRAAAKRAGLTLGEWIRSVLNEEAGNA